MPPGGPRENSPFYCLLSRPCPIIHVPTNSYSMFVTKYEFGIGTVLYRRLASVRYTIHISKNENMRMFTSTK